MTEGQRVQIWQKLFVTAKAKKQKFFSELGKGRGVSAVFWQG